MASKVLYYVFMAVVKVVSYRVEVKVLLVKSLSMQTQGKSSRVSVALSTYATRSFRIRETLKLSEPRTSIFTSSIFCHPYHITKMADDTRKQPKEDLSKEALTVDPNYKPFSGSQWKGNEPVKPPENANMMAGGTQHTAGGKEPEVNLVNAIKTGRPFTEVHKAPCVRDSLLQGIGAGTAIGATRMIFGSTLLLILLFYV